MELVAIVGLYRSFCERDFRAARCDVRLGLVAIGKRRTGISLVEILLDSCDGYGRLRHTDRADVQGIGILAMDVRGLTKIGCWILYGCASVFSKSRLRVRLCMVGAPRTPPTANVFSTLDRWFSRWRDGVCGDG